MKTVDKWAERVYSENDFGRSVATSIAGLIGLIVYLITKDWVIAAFSTIISFPLIRLISTSLHDKAERHKKRILEKEEAEELYSHLSDDEKNVINSFVKMGGCVLTWRQMNNEAISSAGVESLIQREVLWTSMTADGMSETFVLDSNIFDIVNKEQHK